jgi:hypothetical protein
MSTFKRDNQFSGKPKPASNVHFIFATTKQVLKDSCLQIMKQIEALNVEEQVYQEQKQ